MKDFYADKFYSYTGPNYYIDKPSMVFNLYLDPEGPSVEFYKDRILEKFPELEENYPDRVADLFAMAIMLVSKMGMNLYIDKYNISRDEDEWIIAFENLDEYLSKDIIFVVQDWFRAMNENNEEYDFDAEFLQLKDEFDKTVLGGPTIYSLIEGGIKRGINVHFLYEENQFQWGYGKKQLRGRSTIFHTDGIKDTEFTSYKDMVGEWLEQFGFPTPKGLNCFEVEEAIEVAEELAYPVVVKPVAGHKGQGVTTGVSSPEEVKKAFQNILNLAEEEGITFEGTLVQQQIYGYDHRILCIGGKYAATLKRIPAFIVGNGTDTIKELIRVENEKEVRIDNARSPLAKIHIDDDLIDYLTIQNKTIDTIPEEGEEIVLRRVANISAGGVSINVTDEINQKNIEMVENIAKYLNVTALGIDVLAADITKPWTDGDFGIIEINAGPGVFMHLAPAEGGTIDVPGIIMEHHFGKEEGGGRIPIVAGNNISDELINKIYTKLTDFKADIELASLRKDGIYFNNTFVNMSVRHDENVKMIMRNPLLDFAVLNHSKENIHDFGIWHQGLDVAILNHANYAEYILMRDLLPGGILIEIKNTSAEEEIVKIELILSKDLHELRRIELNEDDDIDHAIFTVLVPYLEELVHKYD
ncbi:MAG: ATP-grasp domain-containing protein [Bacteroidetes bacterium]|nr:ATP-grasp domain-containing protein [Bacteroidota bacterium]MBT6686005.1 ATP-grasp domain-containing protein [Bacteroidota bacterium]MBT7143787.1 ATP-grasp domain-containing protein [Bacteroidota bacterium]MBT7490886.1 ATP-grasp domain-containing protein [Bacteroidota bacterium]